MNRWNELCHNFGFQILFPRLCLYGLLPALILLGPGNIAWAAYWSPAFDWFIVVLFGIPFLLNLAANLAISRYLRRHQTAESPYEYQSEDNLYGRTPYFRVQVIDRSAFSRDMKALRIGHKGEAISLWLRFDDLLLLPAILLGVFWLLWACAQWVVRLFPARRRTMPM